VSIEQLWAGWRSSYIASVSTSAPAPAPVPPPPVPAPPTGAAGAGGRTLDPLDAAASGAAGDGLQDSPGCVFCEIASGRAAAAWSAGGAGAGPPFILWRGERVLAMLNAYPYAPGHLMVLPSRHVGDLELLEAEESAELWGATQDGVRALKAAYHPDGLNLGINLGRAAGAGIPAHLHIHVVPRWLGDTNFTTAVASLRVLPEPMPESWEKLRAAWPA